MRMLHPASLQSLSHAYLGDLPMLIGTSRKKFIGRLTHEAIAKVESNYSVCAR